jgi:hypothetical protein
MAHQPPSAEIDDVGIGHVIGCFSKRAAANESPSSHFTTHDPPALRQRVSAAHSTDGDAQLISQLALRRKPAALGEDARFDVVLEGVHEGLVLGFSVRSYLGSPTCHSDNVLFDSDCVNIDIADSLDCLLAQRNVSYADARISHGVPLLATTAAP